MVPLMRRVFHHLPILMALLILATGLSLASAGGASAHPPMHHNAGGLSSAQMEPSSVDHPACTSSACRSDTAEDCCHMAAASCGGAQVFCTSDATLAIRSTRVSIDAPRPTPRLSGCMMPVEQRPPATLA